MTAMLNVKDLRAYYGQVQALHGLSFALNEGSLTTQRIATGVQEGTPGPESPKFKPDSSENGAPAPARDEGAGES